MKRTLTIAAVSLAFFAGMLVTDGLGIVEGQQKKNPGEGFAAVPGLKGGQDVFGPYDPVQNWPRPLGRACRTTMRGPTRRPPMCFPRARTACS